MDHRLLVVFAVAQLIGLGCCVVDGGDSSVDTKRDGLADVDSAPDDLDTQETGWLLDEKMRKLEYLKNKVIYPFTALKSPSYGGGGGSVYPVYGGGKPGLSYGGGFSPSFSYGASFNPSLSYGASFNPGVSYGGNFKPGYSYGGGSAGFYPGYKQKVPFIGGYPSQPFQNKFNFFQKFNPISFKQNIPQRPWYSSSFNGGFYKPGFSSYAPDCNYYIYSPSPSVVQPAPVYTTGTPLSSYYSTVGPTQTYGRTKSAYLGGSAQVTFQSSLPSPVLQVPSPQLRDGSSWAPSIPSFQQQNLLSPGSFSGYAPQYPNVPTSFPSPPNSWVSGTASYPLAPPSPPPQTVSPQVPSVSYPFSWSSVPPSSGPSSFPSVPFQGSGGSQYIMIPQGSGSSYSDQAGVAPQEVVITPAPPQVRGQYVTTPPEAVGYPGAIYFSSDQGITRDSSDSSGESQPSLTAETNESSDAHPESSESTTTTPPPPPPPAAAPVPPQPAPVLTTYYTSNTIDQTRVPLYFYIQPANGGFYSSPAGYGYSSYYLGPLPPGQTKQPVTPRPC